MDNKNFKIMRESRHYISISTSGTPPTFNEADIFWEKGGVVVVSGRYRPEINMAEVDFVKTEKFNRDFLEKGTCEKCKPRPICRKCGGFMLPGKAILQTYTGIADFLGGETVTMSPGGGGELVDCLKCSSCGHSVTR